MYHIYELCDYIIDYVNINDQFVSCYKLMKLLYFIQAYSLIVKNKILFDEDIIAVSYGIYIEKVHDKYKQFGTCSLYSQNKDLNKYYILNDDKEIINQVIEKFKHYSNTDLMKLIQNQSPWKYSFEDKSNNHIIPIELIKSYFS